MAAQRKSDVQSSAEVCLNKTRAALAGALGADPRIIRVDWHYDVGSSSPAEAQWKAHLSWALPPVGGVIVVACIAVFLFKRRRAHSRHPLDVLELASPNDLCEILSLEHPQTIAAVLGRLSPARREAVLESMDEAARMEVERRLDSNVAPDRRVLDEVHTAIAARLAQFVSRRQDVQAREAPFAAGAGGEVADNALDFDDLLAMDDSTLGEALADLDTHCLAIALRTADARLAQKIVACMPLDQAQELRERMDSIGPVRLSDVEAAQRQVVRAIRTPAGRYVSHAGERIA